MPDPLKKLKDTERENLERGSPRFHRPMLATLTHDRFSDSQWIFECKLDGERCLSVCRQGPQGLSPSLLLYFRCAALRQSKPDEAATHGSQKGAQSAF